MVARYYDIQNGLSELNQSLKSLSKLPCTAAPEFKLYQKTSEETAAAAATACTLTTAIEGHGWLLGVQKQPISSIAQTEMLGNDSGVTPPEMVFGQNQFIAHHAPSGLVIQFNVLDALKGTTFEFQRKEPKQLKVKLNNKSSCHTAEVEDVKELELPFDWTYSSSYSGSMAMENVPISSSTESDVGIDYEKLQVREPILWFQELDLFEDELHDHGLSRFSIKVRVMPSGFFYFRQQPFLFKR